MTHWYRWVAAGAFLLGLACTAARAAGSFTPDSTLAEVANFPQFGEYGSLLLPLPVGGDAKEAQLYLKLKDLPRLMPLHSHVDPGQIAAELNYLVTLRERGELVFFDIYPEQELGQDGKDATALMFLPGQRGAPFALVLAGGYSYIATLHEALPLGRRLTESGTNVFVLIYRQGLKAGIEDLSAALKFIQDRAEDFAVSPDGYALWGCSSGGGLASAFGHYREQHHQVLPAALILAYPMGYHFNRGDPPTYIIAGYDDTDAYTDLFKAAVRQLQQEGVGRFSGYAKLGHGFGLGDNSNAAGWYRKALEFWRDSRQGLLVPRSARGKP